MTRSDHSPLLGIGTFFGVLGHWLFISWLVDWAVGLQAGTLLSGVFVGVISLLVGAGGLIFAFRQGFPDYARQVAIRSAVSAACVIFVAGIGEIRAPWAWPAVLAACIIYGVSQASLYPCRLLIAGQIRQNSPDSPAFNLVKFTAVLGLATGYALNSALREVEIWASPILGAACLITSGILFARLHGRLPRAEIGTGLMNQDAAVELRTWASRDRSAAVLLARTVWTSGLAFGGLQVVGVLVLANAGGADSPWLVFLRNSGLLVVSLGLMAGSLTGAGATWRSSQAWLLHVGIWASLAMLGQVGQFALILAILLACGVVLGRMAALVPARLAEHALASEQHSVLSLFAIALTGAPALGALLGGGLAEHYGASRAIVAMALVGAIGNSLLGLAFMARRSTRDKLKGDDCDLHVELMNLRDEALAHFGKAGGERPVR